MKYNIIWKPIAGFEGLYEVSNLGEIKSLYSNKVLKPQIINSGYCAVHLYRNGKMTNCLVHRLVAVAFIPNIYDLPCVNHKNEDKTDNRVENLEWCSYEYNLNYGSHNEKVSQSLFNNPKTSKSIGQYTLSGELVQVYPSSMEAERNGFSSSCISRCCNNEPRYKSHKGFLWRFIS